METLRQLLVFKPFECKRGTVITPTEFTLKDNELCVHFTPANRSSFFNFKMWATLDTDKRWQPRTNTYENSLYNCADAWLQHLAAQFNELKRANEEKNVAS